MSYKAGSAFIEVAPSFKGFHVKAAQEVQKLRAIKVPVEFDTKGFAPVKKPVRIPVDLDGGSFQRQLREKLAAAAASLPPLEIGVATTAAEQKVRDLQAQIRDLAGKKVGVEISDVAALEQVNAIKRDLEQLGAMSPSIQVRTDAAAAVIQLEAVQAMVDKLALDSPDVHVDANTAAATTKLDLLEAKLRGMSGGSWIMRVGVVALPMLAAAGGAGLGALGGLGALAAGGIGGAVLGAGLGIAAVKGASGLQKKITQADKTRATAAAAVGTARHGVASAQAGAAATHVSGAQAVGDAHRAVTGARRNGARAVEAAERSLGNAEKQVTRAMSGLHTARQQAIRDLETLRAATLADLLAVRAAQMSATDAERHLADVQANVFSTSDDIARARLAAAQAEQKLSDARRKSTNDAQDLAKAEKAGIAGNPAVKAARDQVTQAREQAAQARLQLHRARGDAARSVADAERNLSRARADAARADAQAAAQVAQARAVETAAEQKLTTATQARATLLAQMTPMQQKALAALTGLHTAWRGFMKSIESPLLGAMITGMGALEKIFRPLSVFVRPVARALGYVFGLFGDAAATKGATSFAHTMGVFSGKMIRQGGKALLNFAIGMGNLLAAFIPVASSMSSWLLRLSGRFKNWSKHLGKDGAFQRFIAFVKTNGPVIGHALGQVWSAIVQLGIALAPLGVWLFKALGAFAGWVAQTAKAHPLLIRIVGVVALLLVAFTTIMGPIGAFIGAISVVVDIVVALGIAGSLIVGAFIAIGAALVILYFKWKPFHKFVNWSLGLIKDQALALWGAFKMTLKGIAWVFTHVLWPVIKFCWDHVVKPIFGWIGDGLSTLGKAFGKFGTLVKGVWNTIWDTARYIALEIVDKVAWMADKLLGVLGKIPGKIGQPFRDAQAQVKAFRVGVNKELDAIRDEKVNISLNTITIRNAQNKVDHQLTRGKGQYLGGKGPIPFTHTSNRPAAVGGGGPGIMPHVSASLAPAHRFATTTQAQAAKLARVEAKAAQARMRRRQANGQVPTDAAAPAASGAYGRPVKDYRVTATWQSYPGHTGIDLAAPMGTPVFSAGAGRIIKSYDLPGSNAYNSTPFRSYGRVVEIAHPGGFSTLYAHLSQRLGRVGQTVGRGALIGTVGMNGNATGPHLHFETRPGGHPVNPAPFMAARGLQFDRGGELPQGLTMAYHGPSRPDKVLTDAQFRDMHTLAARAGSAGPATFVLYDADNQLIGSMRGIAAGTVDGARRVTDTRQRAGMKGSQ